MNLDRLPLSYLLIAANVVIFLVTSNNYTLLDAFAFEVGPVLKGEVYRLFTSGFLHASVPHLAFNMLTLFFFGPLLEDKRMLGKSGFLIVYFGSMAVGGVAALFFNMDNPYYSAVGASGAISGIMVAISLFAPFLTILVMGIIPVPAIIYAVLFICYSAFAMENSHSNIGHEAHLGGALAGLVITIALEPRVLPLLKHQVLNALSRFRRK